MYTHSNTALSFSYVGNGFNAVIVEIHAGSSNGHGGTVLMGVGFSASGSREANGPFNG